MSQKVRVTIEGKEYESIKDYAKKSGIKSTRVYCRRYMRGKDKEDNFDTEKLPMRSGKNIKVVYDGQVFDSLASLAKYLNINYITFYARYVNGRQLDAKVRKCNNHEVVVRGKSYRSISEVCKEFNFNYQKVLYYIKRYKDTIRLSQRREADESEALESYLEYIQLTD